MWFTCRLCNLAFDMSWPESETMHGIEDGVWECRFPYYPPDGAVDLMREREASWWHR